MSELTREQAEQEARKLADGWYKDEDMKSFVRREGPIMDLEHVAAWATKHFRLAFIKGCQLSPGWTEARQRIAQLEAEVARLTEELHAVKVERGRNAMSHMNEYHRAEKWKAEAQWAARLIYDGTTKDENSERAQRILDGQL